MELDLGDGRVVSMLAADFAEKLAAAEDAGFARALDTLKVPDHQRYEMLMEMRAMHPMRVRLYTAQMRVKLSA